MTTTPPASPELRAIIEEENAKDLALRRARLSTCGMAALLPRPANRPYVAGRFHLELGKQCDLFTDACMRGESPWVNFSAPPRHGKTEHVGKAMPARAMLLRPAFCVLYGTSDADRAEDVSLAVRETCHMLAADYGIEHLAPSSKWSRLSWETVGGNKWEGVGIGKSTGGIGADMVLWDDTTGKAENYRSAAFRRMQRRALNEDFLSRLMDGGGFGNMETRRGIHDAKGYIQEAYPGKALDLAWPLIADEEHIAQGPHAHDSRELGEYLWPAKYGARWHENSPQIRGLLLAQLYQQRPQIEGGALWRADWLQTYDASPEDQATICDLRALAVDGAATVDGGNHTVLADWGWNMARSQASKLGQERGQWGAPEFEARLEARMQRHRYDAVLIEATSNGRAIGQRLQQRYPNVILVPATGSKLAKFLAVLTMWESGKAKLPRHQHPGCGWVHGYIQRLLAVTGQGDEIDDEADADTIALRWFLDRAHQPGHSDEAWGAFMGMLGG